MNYNTIEGVKKYRDHPNISQSQLKANLSGKTFKGSLSSMFGSYLDALMTMPDEVDSIYVVADSKRPSKTVCTLLEQFKWLCEQRGLDGSLEELRIFLEDFIVDKDWYAALSKDKQATNLINKGEEWWDFLRNLGEATVITQMEVDKLTLIHENVKPILQSMYNQGEVYFQKDYYWEHVTGLGCKGLADIIIEKDDELVEIDIKYTECKTIESWFYIMKDLFYPFQKTFYKDGIEKNTTKPLRQYWLVLGENIQHLVEFNEEMYDIGKFGYSKIKSTYERKIGGEGKMVYGYEHVIGVEGAIGLWGVEKSKEDFFINGAKALDYYWR